MTLADITLVFIRLISKIRIPILKKRKCFVEKKLGIYSMETTHTHTNSQLNSQTVLQNLGLKSSAITNTAISPL